MEVAGQWRRQWAGTAEYGKITEGGVTRQVARAMEVLNASAPGARVRVMRAAYHSSAGPGAPASSFLMHSSRKVLSSGYNFLEPSSLPSEPLEISSTPLEISPDRENWSEAYKVTEPDDFEISEPSKWRNSTRINSLRMPSEESSSTDNASSIDLDSRVSSRNTLLRRSKEKEEFHRHKTSPLLDAPIALSTLKYTSLLNGNDDWNNRRKSYSFEDTSPVDNVPANNMFIKDLSTDSGICKSTEIVNDYLGNVASTRTSIHMAKIDSKIHKESFEEWLSKNRSNSLSNSSSKSKETFLKGSRSNESKISVQSSGKGAITLSTAVSKVKQNDIAKFSDDNDKKTKKVEFCKTELHFAVDTGTVNIIATDEKPPPSNDFRRRRSAFVPLNGNIDRSITLFGEKNDDGHCSVKSELADSDDNIAATKSILKNKIPKPKPYLLGENMVFGNTNMSHNDDIISGREDTSTDAVCLINKQLQTERGPRSKIVSICDHYKSNLNTPLGAGSKSLQVNNDFKFIQPHRDSKISINNIPHDQKISPINSKQTKSTTRELRGTDLVYFGIDKVENHKDISSEDNLQEEEIFHSVKLVQQVSNSVCNSETDSNDYPEYQNISIRHNLKMTPIPKPRTKCVDKIEIINEPRILKPIIEKDMEKVRQVNQDLFKERKDAPLRQQRILESIKNTTKTNLNNKNSTVFSSTGRNTALKIVKINKEKETTPLKDKIAERNKNKVEQPLYVNINKIKAEKCPQHMNSSYHKYKDVKHLLRGREGDNSDNKMITNPKQPNSESEKIIIEKKGERREVRPENVGSFNKPVPQRTVKLTTPDHIQETVKRHTSNKNTSTNKNNTKHNIVREETQNSLRKNENKIHDLTNEDPKSTKEETINVNINNETKDNIFDKQHCLKETTISPYSPNSNKTNKKYTEKTSKLKTNKKTDSNARSKRSKYVINYDDKNGTVSSVCKIKSGPGTYKRKLVTVENKDAQDSNTNKSLNKIALRK